MIPPSLQPRDSYWFSTAFEPSARRHALRMAFRDYQLRYLAPLMRALIGAAAVSYVVFMLVSTAAGVTAAPWPARLGIGAALAALTAGALRARSQPLLIALCFGALAALEAGIALHGLGGDAGVAWTLPAFVAVPIASAPLWLSKRGFAIAMLGTLSGPAAVVALAQPSAPACYGAAMYLGLAILIAATVNWYIARTMYAHFHLERRLFERAYTDDLTGAPTRQRFIDLALKAVEHGQRLHTPVSALYVDADHFKEINDRFGHAIGDQVLVAIAGILADKLRALDVHGRLGGEEFGVVLPGLPLNHALKTAERLRVAAHGVRLPDGNHLTVSVGVAELQPQHDLQALLEDADRALRAAKTAGRDRVEFCRPDTRNLAR